MPLNRLRLQSYPLLPKVPAQAPVLDFLAQDFQVHLDSQVLALQDSQGQDSPARLFLGLPSDRPGSDSLDLDFPADHLVLGQCSGLPACSDCRDLPGQCSGHPFSALPSDHPFSALLDSRLAFLAQSF